MKCPECTKEGKRSTVTQGMIATTAMYIPRQWDEDGGPVEPGARNKTTTRYSCSHGHEWAVTR